MMNDSLKPRPLPQKLRVNISIGEDDLRKMDEVATRFGVSRSYLIGYCFRFWFGLLKHTEDDNNAAS